MIKIISGVYGHRPRKGIVEPKRPGDTPFELPPEQEAALVAKGVAAYVPGTVDILAEPGPPDYTPDMKLAELQAVAAYYGIDASGMRKKADVIAAIETKLSAGGDESGEDEDEDEDEEYPDTDAPNLEPEEPQA